LIVTHSRKSLTALAAAATIAVAAIATPTTADARWGWGPALGGFAVEAIIGSALARPYYGYYGYGYPAYGYYAPAYYAGGVLTAERGRKVRIEISHAGAPSGSPASLTSKPSAAVPKTQQNSDKLTGMMLPRLYRGIWLIRG
jgi:hypothetical protein